MQGFKEKLVQQFHFTEWDWAHTEQYLTVENENGLQQNQNKTQVIVDLQKRM